MGVGDALHFGADPQNTGVNRPLVGRRLGAVEITAGLDEGDRIVISSLEPFRGEDSVLITD